MPRVFVVEDETTKVIRGYRCSGDVGLLCNLIGEEVAKRGGEPIQLEDLPSIFSPTMSIWEAEKLLIQRSLKIHPRNLNEAARSLGISRTTLWRRVKAHGIEPGSKPRRDRKNFGP